MNHVVFAMRTVRVVLLFCLLACTLQAAPPTTVPAEGLRTAVPEAYALTGGRVVVAPGSVLPQATVVIRDGIITAVGPDVSVPPDARVVDLSGKMIYPGLVDAFGQRSFDQPSSDKGAPYWNSQVRPQFSVAEQFSADKSLNAKLRRQGITVQLVAPSGGVIKGTSALVTTADEAGSEAIVKRDAALHLRLTARRRRDHDRRTYPASPMGAVALARQAFYDANWYGRAWTAYRANPLLPRPERNDALAELQRWLDGRRLVIADAPNELFFLRADRFAREFGLKLAVRGSGNEYRRLEAVAQTGRPVILPVHFPKPPNVATPEAALDVPLEELMHWDIAPENPARLVRAGMQVALCTYGLDDVADFLAAVRKAVARGLSADAALAALTTAPAELFGVADRLGTIQPGKMANLVVTDGNLFDDEAKVVETWVAGRRYQVARRPPIDVRGTWRCQLAQGPSKGLRFDVQLQGPPQKLAGSLQLRGRQKKGKSARKAEPEKLSRVGLRDNRLAFSVDGQVFQRDGVVQITVVVVREKEVGPIWIGDLYWPDGTRAAVRGRRIKPPSEQSGQTAERAGDAAPAENKDAAEGAGTTDAPPPGPPPAASFPVNYPLGAFGRTALPDQPPAVLFHDATIWTCGPAGVIEHGDLLIGRGKILEVGRQIKPPRGATIVRLNGAHITPGIIDCHSHMATDGGVNEGTQAITAEVRIGDFINCDDVTIYRQLAGGVTCSNILHGSANPIGGQNQVIKLRWGALDEQLKFGAAPPSIKFALGENVKQSNWGDDYTTRYPQTRMGVEQLIWDEFQAARRYQQQWDRWRRTHEGLPPRRDLELDAIVEVLQGKRLVHCHAYRQDEILALMRVAEQFGVRIATFQHVLEGYKVADEMARHGAMGSAFSDWWAYKFEVYDAIPYNGALMHQAGVVVSFNSDDRELGRHLNHEAAKAIKYGGIDPAEALKFVTLNPAIQLGIDKRVGSLEVGKDADLVVWNGPPLSCFSRCEQTWIDGRRYFDRQEDAVMRAAARHMRSVLIQKILASNQPMRKAGERDPDEARLWPQLDPFCCRHVHQTGVSP